MVLTVGMPSINDCFLLLMVVQVITTHYISCPQKMFHNDEKINFVSGYNPTRLQEQHTAYADPHDKVQCADITLPLTETPYMILSDVKSPKVARMIGLLLCCCCSSALIHRFVHTPGMYALSCPRV